MRLVGGWLTSPPFCQDPERSGNAIDPSSIFLSKSEGQVKLARYYGTGSTDVLTRTNKFYLGPTLDLGSFAPKSEAPISQI